MGTGVAVMHHKGIVAEGIVSLIGRTRGFEVVERIQAIKRFKYGPSVLEDGILVLGAGAIMGSSRRLKNSRAPNCHLHICYLPSNDVFRLKGGSVLACGRGVPPRLWGGGRRLQPTKRYAPRFGPGRTSHRGGTGRRSVQPGTWVTL